MHSSTHNSNMELDTNDHLETGSTAAAASIRRSTRASKATTTLPSASSQPKSQPTKESANRRGTCLSYLLSCITSSLTQLPWNFESLESAQPQRPRREQQYSAENEFEQDEESQSDAESESLSESEHESTGNRRNRSNKSGATSKNTVRKSKDQKAQSSESESQLFEIINNSPNALEMALRDWLDTYNASKEKGMVELVEMLVQVSNENTHFNLPYFFAPTLNLFKLGVWCQSFCHWKWCIKWRRPWRAIGANARTSGFRYHGKLSATFWARRCCT